MNKDLLLVNKTIKEFGYDPNTLTYGSNKKICHRCDICDEVKTNTYQHLLKGIGLSHTKCSPAKNKKTLLKNHGVTNPMQLQFVKDKIKETNLERYGCEYSLQNDKVKEKSKQTNLKKYGYENASSSPEIKEKRAKNNKQKYGHESVLSVPEVREKINKTNLKKYGVAVPGGAKNEFKTKKYWMSQI